MGVNTLVYIRLYILGVIIVLPRSPNNEGIAYVYQVKVIQRYAHIIQGSRVIRSSVLVFMALLALAPVLKTLTEATSSDSIWALSFSLFGLHTLLADYTAPSPHESRERYDFVYSCQCSCSFVVSLTSVLSMNAAISASVVLASRLDSDLSVFALVLLAVQIFALSPLLRRQLSVRELLSLIQTVYLHRSPAYSSSIPCFYHWVIIYYFNYFDECPFQYSRRDRCKHPLLYHLCCSCTSSLGTEIQEVSGLFLSYLVVD